MANEDLQAGRDLDVLIAIEVMWRIVSGDAGVDAIPAYSTTYEGMGLVLERMRGFGWYGSVKMSLDMSCYARFTRNASPKYHGFEVDADTLPHAVCLAALKAVRSG